MPEFRRATYGDFLQAVWPNTGNAFRNLDAMGYAQLVQLGQIIVAVLDEFGDDERQILKNLYGLNDGRRHKKTDVGKRLGLTASQIADKEIKALDKVRMYRYGGHSLYTYVWHRSLFSVHPEMLGEWNENDKDKSRSGRSKSWGAKVKINSRRLMNWTCKKDRQHQWKATPSERSKKDGHGKDCPFCFEVA